MTFFPVGLTVNADGQQILVYGEDSLIECLVESHPPPRTTWSVDGVPIDPTSKCLPFAPSPVLTSLYILTVVVTAIVLFVAISKTVQYIL